MHWIRGDECQQRAGKVRGSSWGDGERARGMVFGRRAVLGVIFCWTSGGLAALPRVLCSSMVERHMQRVVWGVQHLPGGAVLSSRPFFTTHCACSAATAWRRWYWSITKTHPRGGGEWGGRSAQMGRSSNSRVFACFPCVVRGGVVSSPRALRCQVLVCACVKVHVPL